MITIDKIAVNRIVLIDGNVETRFWLLNSWRGLKSLWAVWRTILGISLRDKILNMKIRRRTYAWLYMYVRIEAYVYVRKSSVMYMQLCNLSHRHSSKKRIWRDTGSEKLKSGSHVSKGEMLTCLPRVRLIIGTATVNSGAHDDECWS